MNEPGGNLARLLAACTALLQGGSAEELASLLEPEVTWQGLRPELVCHSSEEVLDLLVRSLRRQPRLTRLELEEFGAHVAVSVAGTGFPPNDLLAAGAPRSLVFSFRDGRVVRMQSFPTRDAAFDTAPRMQEVR